ncbi:pyruvate dehydrogenase E1 component alpha subunit [Bacillus thermophilus]|uniref:Pyruvate dehydrogenase E1 component subunit alpha n=1 Tax=Siminovitchia thermophila TaxID=1245522 RepID=A0ABS2R665_9BACI|nr:pyruvate dehydrogenase (acetyl-transferring) E1 component subunit alpha [Siminovitchia thermophila]MBM7715128.1 pyruvate dehydrogenase E1 component alpha subunit [Siminovitchia thermophila]ONK22796.1 pyruvate dehydrogenase (acetyl-transferring) E1 component subunit alpha [Bacillus sp. VT-16-64]
MENFEKVVYLQGNGKLVKEEIRDQISDEFLRKVYRQLTLMRTFDRKAINLQRQGRLGTYAPFEGQEAAQVGSALALQNDDWIFPTYRDHAATMTFGLPLETVLLYWNGRAEGCIPPSGKRIFPPAVPLATQLPHAAGAAMAEQYKGTNNAVIVYFGDGSTSEGDFHEGMNFASIFKAPVVFFNQNNKYAISVPIERQMNSRTIAQKAVAYDIPGIRLDGNDIFAVYFETKKALERARNGEGPTLIEAVTWRYGAHTTADDPSKYRDQSLSEQKREEGDPILRLERYMKKEDLWDEQWAASIQMEAADQVEKAVKDMEAFPAADVNDLFDHVFEENPWTIQEQKNKYFDFLRGVTS